MADRTIDRKIQRAHEDIVNPKPKRKSPAAVKREQELTRRQKIAAKRIGRLVKSTSR